jgi:hypothetical protein
MGEKRVGRLESGAATSARALAYDSAQDRIVLFGGVDYTETQIYGDTWVFNYWDQTWTQVNPTASPSPGGWFGMGCSPKANQIVIFGGRTDRDHFTDQTWTYRLAPNKWDQVLKAEQTKRTSAGGSGLRATADQRRAEPGSAALTCENHSFRVGRKPRRSGDRLGTASAETRLSSLPRRLPPLLHSASP